LCREVPAVLAPLDLHTRPREERWRQILPCLFSNDLGVSMNRFTLAAFFLGFALIVAGAAWIYHPLGPLAAGTMLLFAAATAARGKTS
jgi:hypothetical protein